jgi:hypothetical protein
MRKVVFWVEYFIKGFLRAMPIPIRITEISLLLLGLIALAVHAYFPNWEVTMNPLVWQIPLMLLGITFIGSLAWSSFMLYREKVQNISDLNAKINELDAQLDIARKMAYPPITTLMMSPYFKDLDIPLGQFALVNTELANKTFENCRIHGPIVLLVLQSNITHCSFDADIDSTFITTTNLTVSGVLKVSKCTFFNCNFIKVSVIGDINQISEIKRGIKIDPKQPSGVNNAKTQNNQT